MMEETELENNKRNQEKDGEETQGEEEQQQSKEGNDQKILKQKNGSEQNTQQEEDITEEKENQEEEKPFRTDEKNERNNKERKEENKDSSDKEKFEKKKEEENQMHEEEEEEAWNWNGFDNHRDQENNENDDDFENFQVAWNPFPEVERWNQNQVKISEIAIKLSSQSSNHQLQRPSDKPKKSAVVKGNSSNHIPLKIPKKGQQKEEVKEKTKKSINLYSHAGIADSSNQGHMVGDEGHEEIGEENSNDDIENQRANIPEEEIRLQMSSSTSSISTNEENSFHPMQIEAFPPPSQSISHGRFWDSDLPFKTDFERDNPFFSCGDHNPLVWIFLLLPYRLINISKYLWFEDKEYHRSRYFSYQIRTICFLTVIIEGILILGMKYKEHQLNPSHSWFPFFEKHRKHYVKDDDSLSWGAENEYKTLFPKNVLCDGEYYRIVTQIFLHVSYSHYFDNAVNQLWYGCYVNILFGQINFLIIWILGGIYGALLHMVQEPMNGLLGASGANYAFLGAYPVWIIYHWSETPLTSPIRLFYMNWNLLFISWSLMTEVVLAKNDWKRDRPDHLGGLIMGVLLGIVLFNSKSSATIDNVTAPHTSLVAVYSSGSHFLIKFKVVTFLSILLIFSYTIIYILTVNSKLVCPKIV